MEPGKLFDLPSDRISTPENHKKTHECSECGKSFPCRSPLFTHKKAHVGGGSSQGMEGEKSSGTDTKGLRNPPRLKPYRSAVLNLWGSNNPFTGVA
ncbi:hypothetical protein NXF25_004355 [Crotalus adamanteus]|uniref:C2H2-type domain-containing protein n=1 Tax=Crotalus adamanteus TaxID=8729 RepID=A0AAW1BUQ4_CROAD